MCFETSEYAGLKHIPRSENAIDVGLYFGTYFL